MKKIIATLILLSFTVLYPAQVQKLSIVIADFHVAEINPALAKMINEYILNYFIETGKYKVIERSQLENVLREMRLSNSDLADSSNAIKIGKLLSAYGIVIGSIMKFGDDVVITARLVETQSGTIARVAKVKAVANAEEQVDTACRNIAYQLANMRIPAQQTQTTQATQQNTQQNAPQTGQQVVQPQSQVVTTSRRFNPLLNIDLIKAVNDGNIDKVKELLSKNADPNAIDRNWINMPVLVSASFLDNPKISQLLIAKGANVNYKDNIGTSPLMIASQAGQIETVKLLLGKNALVDDKNIYGMTALMYAGLCNKVEVMRLLIEKGADFNAKNKWGLSVMSMVNTAKHNDAIALLNGLGAQSSGVRFKNNGNGTVTDHLTGLMWLQKHLDQRKNYQQAIEELKELQTGGFSDWRLPTIFELDTLSFGQGDSAIFLNENGFIGILSQTIHHETFYYLSSTTSYNKVNYLRIKYFSIYNRTYTAIERETLKDSHPFTYVLGVRNL